MKKLFKNIANNLTKLIAIAAVTVAASSCEKIFDYEGDCDPQYFVKFEYTMHMEKGDAFKEQVQAVELWIFDNETGEYVDHIYSTVADLEPYDYLLPINVKPGNYDFVAWCGHISNRHFKVNDVINNRTHASCRLHKRGYEGSQATSDENLDLLFHGKLEDANLPDQEGTYIYTIPLIRDVNNIVLTLQHISGEFDTENITVTMADNNGTMLHDNSLDETDEHILYKPWSLRTGTLENPFDVVSRASEDGDGVTVTTSGNFLTVELSTARLMANHNPVISIKDEAKGNVMFQIPLTKWLLQLRSEQYTSMGDQEYLDRRNQHELMVFLQDKGDGGWTAVSIVINGWHVIDNGQQEL